MSQDDRPLVYVGTYTRGTAGGGNGEGIYVFRLGTHGALEPVYVMPGVANPTFLALDPRGRYLVAANEVSEFAGQPGGGASAFAIDGQSGALAALNSQPVRGAGPCYVTVDPSGRWALLANYHGGSVSVLPISEDGRLGPVAAFVQHHGSSANPKRQEAAHAHSIILDPPGRYALVADLGMDKIMLYRFDAALGTLTSHQPAWIATRAGAGPRHLVFHPNGRYLYCANELDSTVTAYRYDRTQGTLQEIQTIPTLPQGFSDTDYPADVHITSSGRFLYVSNRGHDSIAIFAVDAANGSLTAIGHEPTRGHWPRNFAITPAGDIVLVANQRTDTIVAFAIDQTTGRLTPTGEVAAVPSPVCVCIRQT